MMRQAVPLMIPDAPIVGTGLERNVARDSRVLFNAEGEGVVEYVDAQKIVIKYDRTDEEELVSFEDEYKTYDMVKFRKTNQGSSITLRPIVTKGQRVSAGDVLCEGYATEKGELAIGRNLQVAFMPWKGYNFEDAIVINERVVREDIFTSIHVDDHTLEVRDTKLGMEELTPDIPNVSEEATKDLDENGIIIRVGAEIKPGDILIGKITPKGERIPHQKKNSCAPSSETRLGMSRMHRSRQVPLWSGHRQEALRPKHQRQAPALHGQGGTGSARGTASGGHGGPPQAVHGEVERSDRKGKTSQGITNDLNEMVLAPKGTKFTQKMPPRH